MALFTDEAKETIKRLLGIEEETENENENENEEEEEETVAPIDLLSVLTDEAKADLRQLLGIDDSTLESFLTNEAKVDLAEGIGYDADTGSASYRVEFYYADEEGHYPTKATSYVTRHGEPEDEVAVKDSDKVPKDAETHAFDTNATGNVLSGEILADNSFRLKVYFKLVE